MAFRQPVRWSSSESKWVVSRQLTSRRKWPIRSITRVLYHQLTWYNSLSLWRWLPHRLSKRQSLSTTTVLFRTTFTRTIKLNLFKVFLERLSFGSLAFAGWPFSYSANCFANYLRINPEPWSQKAPKLTCKIIPISTRRENLIFRTSLVFYFSL